jgi:phosphonate degradation associated HDIG domain protein
VSVIETLFTVFREKGTSLYFGEAVTETEHALQSAYQAERSGATPEVIAAALLHDIGHLLHGLPEDIAAHGIDGKHEDAGARWLAGHFPPAVVDPVRLHVAAKRYLCAVEPGYAGGLSESSQLSLKLQGGPMTPDEVAAFEALPHSREAVALRRWDDGAKVVGWEVPNLEHYRPLLQTLLGNRETA